MWHNAKSTAVPSGRWVAGDTFGTLLQIDNAKVTFYLNGRLVASTALVFKTTSLVFLIYYYFFFRLT